jgi:hypothetical protein
VFYTLRRLPYGEAAGEEDPTAASLVGRADGTTEPRLVVKVALGRLRVWRRLSVPGELTMQGFHLAIQASFGWEDEHLHVFRAGPFSFAPGYVGVDDAVPSELVTMTDLATLGIRELTYRYDLGDCWDHEIVIERILAGGGGLGIECVSGAGTTPAEERIQVVICAGRDQPFAAVGRAASPWYGFCRRASTRVTDRARCAYGDILTS